jgi:hypothetical protein
MHDRFLFHDPGLLVFPRTYSLFSPCVWADPAKPLILGCPPGYGFVQSLTGTPYANYPDYKGGAMCLPCESGFYSSGGRSRCLSCASGASNTGFITPQGASSAAQCVCAAGFGGPGCKICPSGNFRCVVCSGNRSSAVAASVSCYRPHQVVRWPAALANILGSRSASPLECLVE